MPSGPPQPQVPEFIPPDMQASYGHDAHQTVRGTRPAEYERRPTPGAHHRSASQAGRILDVMRAVLVGASIAVAAITVAAGLMFLWMAAPGLAYAALAVEAVIGVAWLAYLVLVDRSRPTAGR